MYIIQKCQMKTFTKKGNVTENSQNINNEIAKINNSHAVCSHINFKR